MFFPSVSGMKKKETQGYFFALWFIQFWTQDHQVLTYTHILNAKTFFYSPAPTHQSSLRSSHLALSRETRQREAAACVVTKGAASVLLNLRLSLDWGYVLVNRAERETNHLSPGIVILTLPLETLACVLWLEQSCFDLSSNTWYWTLKAKKNIVWFRWAFH